MWALYEAARQPDIMKQLHAEADDVLGSGRYVCGRTARIGLGACPLAGAGQPASS